MNYITDKMLLMSSGFLYDVKKNQVKMDVENLVNYNQSLILVSNVETSIKDLRLNQNDYSVLLSNYKFNTFHEFAVRLLELMRYLEYLSCQVAVRRTLSGSDMLAWETFNWTFNEGIRDGHFSSTKIAQLHEDFWEKYPNVYYCYAVYSNVLSLNELVLNELYHAEARIIECINHQIENIERVRVPLNEDKFEYASFSLNSDNAAWCLQDAIKSLATSLDGLTNLAYYLSDCNNISKKVPCKHFSRMLECIEKWDNWASKNEILPIINKLKILTSVRNEITHNRSLYSTRFPLFIGKGTDAIKNLPLFYSDMIFWDHDGTNFDRANNRIGFYSKKLNALTETRALFESVIRVTGLVMEYLAGKMQLKMLENSISEVVVYDEQFRRLRLMNVRDLDCNL